MHILTTWAAANLKLELFDDIHEDPGAICVKCNLATVGFTGTNGKDRSPTHRTILIRLQNDIHDLHNKTDYSEPWSGYWLDRGSVLSSANLCSSSGRFNTTKHTWTTELGRADSWSAIHLTAKKAFGCILSSLECHLVNQECTKALLLGCLRFCCFSVFIVGLTVHTSHVPRPERGRRKGPGFHSLRMCLIVTRSA